MNAQGYCSREPVLVEQKQKAQRFFVPAISAPMKRLFQESVTRAIFMELLWDGAVIEQV
jgi:hypothetical protein